jgi:hypothetical protein
MSNLYGVGFAQGSGEVAAALRDMPKMDGYLDTDGYAALYWHLPPELWPKVFIEPFASPLPETVATVAGEDGWALAFHQGPDSPEGTSRAHLCDCGSGNLAYVLWRGKVALR